jgi:hypothetical protein
MVTYLFIGTVTVGVCCCNCIGVLYWARRTHHNLIRDHSIHIDETRTGPTLLMTMMPPSETLPSSTFESLLPKLLAILQITQRPEGTTNVKNKQDLLQAVSPSKELLYCRLQRQLESHRSTLCAHECMCDTIDPGVPRSSEPGAHARECTPRRRTAHRGAR